MRPVNLAIGAVTALLLGVSHMAYAASMSEQPGTALAGDSDVMFLRKAADAGTMEIAASRLAQTKASSEPVKAFAAMMIRDHGAANEKMKPIAQRLGIQLPSSPPDVKKQELAQLEQLSGPAFDNAYAQQIGIDAHQDAVALFRKAVDDAKDADVKAFARQTLPTLSHHLDMAKQMAAQVKK